MNEFRDESWNGTHLVRIYFPPSYNSNDDGNSKKKWPAILDVHGGRWSQKDRTLDVCCNEALSSSGFIVAAIDFRQGPTYKHPAASNDVKAAMIWLKDNSDRLRINKECIGMLGSSSGGHLAMYAGLTSKTTEHPPKFIIALWPVSCPFQRYRYAKRANITCLIEGTEAYFDSEKAMRQASISRLVAAGEAESLPPLLLVHPGDDANVPVEINMDLIKVWQNFDGYIEYSYFPKEPHAFGLTDSPATRRLNTLIIDFAKRFCN